MPLSIFPYAAARAPSRAATHGASRGDLLGPIAAGVAGLFHMFGRHRVPGQDVELLVCQVEIAASRHFAGQCGSPEFKSPLSQATG